MFMVGYTTDNPDVHLPMFTVGLWPSDEGSGCAPIGMNAAARMDAKAWRSRIDRICFAACALLSLALRRAGWITRRLKVVVVGPEGIPWSAARGDAAESRYDLSSEQDRQ